MKNEIHNRVLFSPARDIGFPVIARRVSILLGVLALVTLIHWWEGANGGLKDSSDGEMSFIDAVYFTMVTVTTVGYGDIVPVASRARVIDAFLVTPIRIMALFLVYGTAYQVVYRRFSEGFRMKKIAARLNGHVIVAGYGFTGRAVCSELELKGNSPDAIVVIDPDEERVQEAANAGHVALKGDASREKMLAIAAIEKAANIIVCLERDDTAVLVCLTARDMNPNINIIAAAREEENFKLLERSGANMVVSPSVAAGNLMAAGTRHPRLAATMTDIMTQGGKLILNEMVAGPAETGKRAKELRGMSVLRIYRGKTAYGIDKLDTMQIAKSDVIIYVETGSAE
ncbi:potassium channel family protein [Candidatus Hydrogenedentota bacterium]